MSDMVNHPNHYANNRMRELIGVECIDFTRHMSFDVGNAFKYVWRCLDKGTTVQDLDKAVFYLNDHIDNIYYLEPYCNDESIKDLVDSLYRVDDSDATDFEKKQLEVLRKIIDSPKEALNALKKLKEMT